MIFSDAFSLIYSFPQTYVISFFLIVITVSLFFIEKHNFMLYFLLILTVLLSVYNQFLFHTDAEDAYIAYRYVRNLVDGHGLVFNPGERVEGYSDFLWIILIFIVHKITTIDIVTVGRGLGILCSIGTLLLTFLLGRELAGKPFYGILAALLVSVSGSFACYGPSGMETPLFALFILTILYFSIKRKWLITGVLIGLATMTRPEGIILVLPVILYMFVLSDTMRNKMKYFLLGASGVIALLLPWTVWRILYYGFLFPNSIAAKKGMDFSYQLQSGFNYVVNFFLQINIPIIILLSLILIKFIWNIRKRKTLHFDPVLFLFISVVVIHSTFIILIGGDWMPAWRFLAPIVPVISLLIVRSWSATFNDISYTLLNRITAVIFILCSFFLFNYSFSVYNMIPRVQDWQHSVDGLREIGQWFHDSLPPDTLVATWPNGAFSYYNMLPTIDMLGLTDEHIARKGKKMKKNQPGHASYDWDYINRRRPAIIADMLGQGFMTKKRFSSFRVLNLTSIFRENYSPVLFEFQESTNPHGRYVYFLILKSRKQDIINNLTSRSDIHVLR